MTKNERAVLEAIAFATNHLGRRVTWRPSADSGGISGVVVGWRGNGDDGVAGWVGWIIIDVEGLAEAHLGWSPSAHPAPAGRWITPADPNHRYLFADPAQLTLDEDQPA
jgi:hypothetical protein